MQSLHLFLYTFITNDLKYTLGVFNIEYASSSNIATGYNLAVSVAPLQPGHTAPAMT